MDENGAELRIASFHGSAGKLLWSALVLVVVAGATGYLAGNTGSALTDVLLVIGAITAVLAAVVAPWWRWASRSYIVTTRRVIETRGVVVRRRRELSHAAGYGIELVRSPLQRLCGTGTVVLTGPDTIELRNVRAPRLVSETLSDQVEVGQILAHREAQQRAADPFLER
ncbi:PH domain-containing protein [Microbacterium sp. gxy059]|uniref:PH domain-containing protein n=1 Tax=Microbacterium sp. gxy059 TaxID=2957199 RepID=UPI003D95C0AC